ncbi:c-type cytochrome [Deinococcus roseus]|uniref:Cytochrome c domain-containing protein n=1 Tax=Deinococcus roseus TaxID=392414 RepID=A0ABQ2D2K8_9DEIO|nr:cytochrome c [Deinococcus roseus]GGJ37613.1 hypothetical protein GCM10008938_24700 [Deinococcus roseus]
MKKMVLLASSLLIPLAFAATPKGNAAKGKTFFEATCSGCHGEGALGGVGPKLAGKLKKWTFAGFKKTLKENVTPDKRKLGPPMMKFNLSDQEYADLLAYLKSLK